MASTGRKRTALTDLDPNRQVNHPASTLFDETDQPSSPPGPVRLVVRFRKIPRKSHILPDSDEQPLPSVVPKSVLARTKVPNSEDDLGSLLSSPPPTRPQVSVPDDELPPSLPLTSDYVKLRWVLLMPSAEMRVCERQ